MAADNVGLINEIAAPEALAQLQTIVDKTAEADANMSHLITTCTGLSGALKSSNNLNDFANNLNQANDTTGQLNPAMATLTQNVTQLNVASQTFTQSQIKTAQSISDTKDEIARLTTQMEAYKKAQANPSQSADGFKKLGDTINDLNTKIAALNARLSSSQASLTQTAVKIDSTTTSFKLLGVSMESMQSIFGRMILRMSAYALLLEPAIMGVGKLKDAILESIPGTDEYIKKIEKTTAANKDLTKSFEDLTEAVSKYDEEQKLIDADGNYDNTVAGLKRKLDSVKAIGVVQKAAFDAETQQLAAAQEMREAELKTLEDKKSVIDQTKQLFDQVNKVSSDFVNRPDIKALSAGGDPSKNKNVQYELFNKLNAAVQGGNIPDGIKSELSLQLQKGYDDGGNLLKILTDTLRKYSVQSAQVNQEISDKKTQIEVAQTEYEAKIRNIKFNKSMDLEKQLAQTHEQLRQSSEKEDVESVDKVVNDTRAKYALLAADISRNREAYRLSVTTKENVGYVDKNTKAYDRLLSTLRAIGNQEQKNLSYELTRAQANNTINVGAGLAGSAAGIAQGNAAFGVPDYNKMAAAQSLETEAKKQALIVQFNELANTITDSDQIIEAQKQQDEKLKQIDEEAYKDRLALATDYFNKIAQKINGETANNLTEDQRRHFDNLTALSKGSNFLGARDRAEDRENNAFTRSQANINIQGINSQLPAAQEAFTRADNATKGPLSANALAEAQKQRELAKGVLDDLYKDKAENEHKIADIDKLEKKKKLKQLNDLKDAAIQTAQDTAAAVKQIQDNQFAAEQQQLQIKMQALENSNEQKIQAINATAGYQISKDNALAKQAAQFAAQQNAIQKQENELALKKAKADKVAAEASVVMNTAIAVTKILANDAYDPPVAAALVALTIATGAAQYAAAASTPLPQYRYGTSATHTPFFIAGEAGENEWIKPVGKPGYWSGTTAKIFHEPLGTSVTPIHKITEFANANVSHTYGKIEAKDNSAKEMATLIGEKIEKSNAEVVYALLRSKNITPPVIINNSTSEITFKIGRK